MSEGASLDEAQDALSTAINVAPGSNADKGLEILTQSQSQSATLIKQEALAVFTTVKSQLATFIQDSSGLTKALDELGQLHPFVQLAVIPFKVALSLELTRRENNKKVLALFVQMGEMMKKLRLLERIKPSELGNDGKSLASRMEERLRRAGDTIKNCSHATEGYYKQNLIPKLIKSGKWETIFADYAKDFTNFADDFQYDLQMYTGTGVQALNRIVGLVDKKMDIVMKSIFETLVSPEEQELNKFIESKGGPDQFMANDPLLMELCRKRKNQLRLASKLERDKEKTTFKDVKDELKDPESLLSDTKKLFDQKFEKLMNQIEEVKHVITRESDRVIERFLSGAHDRILDKVMHNIWVEMGWKGNVKARYLVLALRDYYFDHLHRLVATGRAISDIKNISQNPNTESDSQKLLEINQVVQKTDSDSPITENDRWAIDYISIFRLRPLLEALDPDYSGLVTITEVNDFTSGRPETWTLPHWLAYWTVGFQVMLKQYCYRIREVFSMLSSTYSNLLPGNASTYSDFISAWQLDVVDQVVAGIYTADTEHGEDDEYQHPCFEDHVANSENKLKNELKSYHYCIDDTNTMSLITGPGRLEEHVLPLIYLILRHALRITEQGRTGLLPSNAFDNVLLSLTTISLAMYDRTRALQGCFKLRDVGVKEELRKYTHGLYYYFVFRDELTQAGAYYDMPSSGNDPVVNTHNNEYDGLDQVNEDISTLSTNVHGSDMDLVDMLGYEEVTLPKSALKYDSKGLVGEWSGFYCYGFSSYTETDGIMGFQIYMVDAEGLVRGGGRDAIGDFSIIGSGTFKPPRVSFIKEYLQPQYGMVVKWLYEGVLTEDSYEITGKWGSPVADRGHTNDTEEQPEFMGMFKVYRRSAAYAHLRPPEEAFQENKAKALWTFAKEVMRHELSKHRLHWSVLKTRRDQRKRFITLFRQSEETGLDGKDAEEFTTLRTSLPAGDLRYYRSLANLMKGREVSHYRVSCDGCSIYPIKMTRLICLDCWADGKYDTVDLCSSCITKKFTVTRNPGAQQLDHLPTHRLLQVRRPFMPRQYYDARERAREAEENAFSAERHATMLQGLEHPHGNNEGRLDAEQGGLACNSCTRKLKRPYWSCGDCYQTFICIDCNAKTERTSPWLFERKVPMGHLHDGHRPEEQGAKAAVGAIDLNEGRKKPSELEADKYSSDGQTDGGSDIGVDIQPSETETDGVARIAAAAAEHHWSHDMILCQPPVPAIITATRQDQEKVLESISGVVDDLSTRMERLEGLLNRLLDRIS